MMNYCLLKDIAEFARELIGEDLEPSQVRLLREAGRWVILNCRRQWGKSTLAAICALHRALTQNEQRIVLISPTMRQSHELAAKCRKFARKAKVPVNTDGTNPRSLVFENGSSIVALPARADFVRGFTAHMILIDEAARVSDEVIAAATPMLATTGGALWLLSTPDGPRGIFYGIWVGHDARWVRVEGKASDRSGAPVSAGFLESERQWKTAEEFEAEHECGFATPERNVFAEQWLEDAFSAEAPPFDELSRVDLRFVQHRPAYYIGLDLAGVNDHAALVILEYRATPTGQRDPATWQFLYRRSLHVVGIERFRQRTPYREVVTRVSRLCQHPHLAGHTQLLVEANGPGLPVIQLLQAERLPVSLLPVTTTGNLTAKVSGSGRSVPKKELITVLELLLERRILKIASGLGQADLLREELRQFERWSTRGGSLRFGAGKGHDDLVMALGLATWWAWTNRRQLLLGPAAKALD